MLNNMLKEIGTMDLTALGLFALAWLAYTMYADVSHHRSDNLPGKMNMHRHAWMQQMLKRDNRMVDASLIGNLLRSIAFFANTSIFILIGLVTVLGYRDDAVSILNAIPFTAETNATTWELKVFLLVVIFVYSFFKYTWSLRQYNYACIMVGPAHNDMLERHEKYASKVAKLISNAGRHFNMGLRAYYFGLAALAWFVDARLFMLATIWVIYVIYRREFRSHTLRYLSGDSGSL